MKKPVLRRGAVINIQGKRWFDSINGNTYHTAYVEIRDKNNTYRIEVPFTYGYGDQYEWNAWEKIWERFTPCKAYRDTLEKDGTIYRWKMHEFYAVFTNVADVQRKKDL